MKKPRVDIGAREFLDLCEICYQNVLRIQKQEDKIREALWEDTPWWKKIYPFYWVWFRKKSPMEAFKKEIGYYMEIAADHVMKGSSTLSLEAGILEDLAIWNSTGVAAQVLLHLEPKPSPYR